MALRIFEFRCEACDTVFDELVQHDVYEHPCSACGHTAKRIISAVRIDWQAFAKGKNASEPAIDKWNKMRKKKMGIEQQKLDRHGTYT